MGNARFMGKLLTEYTNAQLGSLIRVAADVPLKESFILEIRKRAFVQGLADRIAGSPMLARDTDGDDEHWADEYGMGYDPRNEMGLTRAEFLDICAAQVAELTKLTGSVIPDVLPRNPCEFPDKFTVEIPIVGLVESNSIERLGEEAWDKVHSAGNGGLGASQVGSGWPVKKNGVLIGTLRYNGRFDATPVEIINESMPCAGVAFPLKAVK